LRVFGLGAFVLGSAEFAGDVNEFTPLFPTFLKAFDCGSAEKTPF